MNARHAREKDISARTKKAIFGVNALCVMRAQ